MDKQIIDIAGIQVPNISPFFLAVIVLHVAIALGCVIAGLGALFTQKGAGKHPKFGTFYYYCLFAVSVSATVLSIMRWEEDYYLFILGTASFLSATIGRSAHRKQWRKWVPVHIWGMGISFIVLLVAFYMDNGKNLPIWRSLPSYTYWLVPSVVGVPLILRAVIKYSQEGNIRSSFR